MSRRHLAALAAAGVLWCPTAQPALADPPAVQQLCHDAPRGCSVHTDAILREGATFPVTVRGRPNTRVVVTIQLAQVDGAGRLTGFVPASRPAELFTGSHGIATATVAVPPLAAGRAGGWALVGVGTPSGTDTSSMVGEFVPLGARIPTLLGDGFTESKPVGTPITLHFHGAIPGSGFVVEYLDAAGRWVEVTSQAHSARAAASPRDVSSIEYTVPRGLTAELHRFRLRNVSDTAVSPEWFVLPSRDGVPAPRRAVLTPPTVGASVAGATNQSHPRETVTAVALSMAAASGVVLVGAALGWAGLGGRR